MDFFSAANPVAVPCHPHAPFAKAIADRFASSPMLSAQTTPVPAPSSPFPAIDLPDLPACLDDPATLLLDIRPHAAYSNARIPRAVSLSVPSTLLKRPLFSLQRLSAMLPSASARNRFSAWHAASRILVYDADSVTVADSSNIAGLLRKFKSDGFQGDLVWLKGGFQAVWRDRRDLIDTLPPTPDAEADDEDDDHHKSSILRTRHLPMAAFSLSSTTVHNSPHFNSSAAPPARRPPSLHPLPAATSASANSHPAFNPFFDTIRQNTELSHGITERIPLRLPRRVRRRIPDLPFPWLQEIARRAANAPPHDKSLSDSSSSESEDDEGANPTDIEEGKEALAMQFFKIELSEQRRLMGVMEHHSKESGQHSEQSSQSAAPFPYSITAGVEKGAKNRYRHIWPFEHARVRLHQKREADDDYVNASYIQPLGTNRRYIATQGPLPATFTDFWTLCWEQNVHVIVMLTREVEGAMVKCGAYWTDTVFGPLRLRLVSTEGLAPPDERPATAGFFAGHSTMSAHSSRPQPRRFPHSAGSQRHYRHHHYHNKRSETVKRTFELTHIGYPAVKPRKIIHLQYLEWPDLNVPEDPRGVLSLIKQVDEAVEETRVDAQLSDVKKQKKGDQIPIHEIDENSGIGKHALASNHPVLLHCSAGVGRTGGFIAVDAILDAIRREVRSKNMGATDDDAMDVDHGDTKGTISTAPLTVSSGVECGKTAEQDSGLLVHVPVATPMQVDKPDSAASDVGCPATFPSGTMRWAENVRDETGVSGTSAQRQPTIQDEVASANSTTSLSTPGSSRGGSSSETRQFHGSYYYNSSSSLGTSVSGTSSSSKANLPSSSYTRDISLTSDLRQTALNNQQSAIERTRTMSTPSMNTRTLPPSLSKGSLPHLGQAARSTPSLSKQSERTNGQNDESPTNRVAQTSALSFDFSNTSPFKLKSLVGGMSSDGEPPSRSQSPSADEATTYRLSLPPQPSIPVIPSYPMDGSSPEEQQTKTFDYKEPRPLHEDYTPPVLTTLGDPIWEVIQDMREQRMSLCQSLRQYVFVHAAIIEGALMVVDEEREIAEGLKPRARSSKADQESSPTSPMFTDAQPPLRAQPTHPYSHEIASIASSSSMSIGKRGASPTELTKEDKEGDVMLSKRPSIKRKQRSGDDLLVDDARYHPVPARATPRALHAGVSSARAMPP